jgi:predicted transcriptional regulator
VEGDEYNKMRGIEYQSISQPERISLAWIRNDSTDDTYSREISEMVSRPDLLISLEQVMNKHVITLKRNDTLGTALTVFSQGISEIVVIDESNQVLGVIRDSECYRKFSPNISELPLEYRRQSPKFQQIVALYDINTSRIKVEDLLDKTNPIKTFQSNETLSSLISDRMNIHGYYSKPRSLPILDKNHRLVGVITFREIMKYIQNDPFLAQMKSKDLQGNSTWQEIIYLLPDTALLADAELAMHQLPIDNIFCHNSNFELLGIVNRSQINKLSHHFYPDLGEKPLGNFLQSVGPPFLINSRISVSEMIRKFIDFDVDFLLYPNGGRKTSVPIFLVNPLTILRFFSLSFQ